MWSREELKNKAKEVLRKNYWNALGVSIVIALAGGNFSRSGGGNFQYRTSGDSFYSAIHSINFGLILAVLAIVAVSALVAIALRIFIGYSLEVGGRRYFIKSAQNGDNRKYFSFGFDRNNYKGIVMTMLVTNIYLFLWTLLFIIPGIIKSYAYRMVPYILADNPNLGVNEAIALSNEMTRGHKLDMFVLDLSFIGWYLLGVIACGIGVLFVHPYVNATNAELYLVLRKDALKNNLCSYGDLLMEQTNSEPNNDMWL